MFQISCTDLPSKLYGPSVYLFLNAAPELLCMTAAAWLGNADDAGC